MFDWYILISLKKEEKQQYGVKNSKYREIRVNGHNLT